MTCSLTDQQLENLYRVVYTEIALARKDNRPFDIKAFSSDLYKSILQKSGDANKAATFVQQVPEFVLSAMTVNELWRHLSSTGFDANQVMSLAREFKDEQKGFSNVVDYVGAKVDQKQQEQEIIADQNGKDEVQPGVEDVPEEESAKPSNPWSTTGQEAKYWNPKKNPREFAARNQIDADKSFHNSVVRSVGTAVREAEGDSSKARLGNHVGFKLQVVPATEFPFEHLYKETQLWLTGPEADQEKHNKGVLAVITDNEGNWLYFNDKGEVGTREDGRPVYQFIRVPREKAGELNFMRYHPESGQLIEQLLTPKEMLAKEQREAAKNGTPYTEEFSKQRLEELTQERKDKTAFIKKMRDFVSSDKKNRVLLDITGGTLGVFTQKWSKIGKFVTDEDMRSITLDKSVTGTGGGRYMIRLKNIATPIPIDRPQINADLAFKIASVLTLPIKVEGEYLPNSAKVDYAKQFLQNGNKYSNNFTVSYNPEDGSIFVSIAGAKSTIPTPEQLERSGLSTENLRKHIVDSLMNVFWREQVKGQPEYKPSRLSINDDLVSRGEYVDYNLQTDNGKITSATAESKNYYDFLRENAQIGVAGTNDMDVTMLNAYLHFAPTQEVVDQVEGKTKEEPKAKAEVKAPDPHEDDINSDLISGLLKSRGLDNSATQDQIRSAKNWYENSPLAKHISFKAMFNVVNSDAFARWTVDGITLYQGANYTDLYHEAWHGFSQLFLTKEQKKKLYEEARNIPGLKDKSDFEIEEHLAEDFRKYVMSGAKSQAGKTRNSIFRRIWNFLKEFFFGISPRDAQTQPDSVAKIHEVYNRLFFGQLNEYLPSINNVQFGVLNKGIEPVEKTSEEEGEKVVNQPLSLEESRLVVDSIDSLISEAINQLNRYRGDTTATTQILTEKSKLSKLYENIKENFQKRRDKYAEEAERESDPFLKRKLEDNIRLLNYIIKNFGDPAKVLAGSESKGVVFYHQQKTKFLGVSQRIYDVTDEVTSDEDVINKGMRRNDRAGNELSLKELANDETLYLIRSLHRIDEGKVVKNRLGIPELVDFDKTWNKIVRTLEGSITPEEMYSKLQATQGIFPEFTQLLQKLADPSRTSLTRSEFDMNTKFWQDFNKPRVPLIQMILDKSVREDSEGNVSETYDMRVGQASADYFKVIGTWKNKFRTDSPSNNKYILQDAQRHNYLNTSAVMRDFADPRGQLKEGREYEFLRAIGMYFDESNPIMEDLLKAAKGAYGVGYIFNAIKTVNNALQTLQKPTSEQQAAHTAAHAFILDPIEGLRKPQPDLRFDTNASRVKALAELHAKFSDEYSDFSVVNAENNRQYEHTLNNTLTVIINSINKAKTYQELVDPLVDTENNFRHMRWLNINRNPIAASSVWLNSVFDLDRFKPDGSPNQNFGKKRMASTEEGSGPVKINLENLSGVQIVINGLYPETGIATSRSDRFTKFLSDFHMMLLNGRVELMRHASKSSAYDIVVSSLRTDPSKKDANLYVDTSKFISPKGSDNYDGFGYAFKIIQGYIGAELRRVRMVNENLDYYRTVAGYNREVGGGQIAGQVLTAFDDVLSDSLKQQLYNLKVDFQQAMAEDANLRDQVKTQVKQYFDKQVAQNNAILNETGEKYIHQRVYEKIRSGIKGLSNEQVEQAAVRSFTYNSWIHNFESTALIYGDLCQYNHAKEEFHKRNAGTGSTGYMFRTDKAAQQHITDVVGRKYAESIGAPARGYNGTFNTAVLADSVVDSVYEKEYRDFFTRYYNDLYSSRKDLNQAQKSKLVSEKVEAAMEPYSRMKEGDGQGWVSFDSYRIMRILEGKWTENQERLYHDIIQGKHKGNAEVLQFFPAYKVQQYGPLETSGLPVMAFHKFSLFPMIPSVIQGTNMELVHNMMVNQGIDYALFESGSKLGALTSGGKPDKIYSDNQQRVINQGLQFTKNTVFANYLKDQLDIHNEYKGKVIFPTQLRKLIEEGLFENGVPTDFLPRSPAEKKISQWSGMDEQAKIKASPLYSLAKRYEDHIDELSQLKKQELLEEAGWTEDKYGNPVGDLKNLLDVVRNNLGRQDIADHQLDFLDTDEVGNLKWDLSMHLNADKLERLLTAMVNNRLVRQKVKGESLVQVSTTLFEKAAGEAGATRFTNPTAADLKKYGTNDLPTYHKVDPKDPNSKTAAMKVKIALQGDSRNLLNLMHNDGSPISTRERLNEMLKSEEWLDRGANRRAVTMVGVRIPVQGLNSMEFMEVYEFLPEEAGNIIVPPSEIVAKSGADFDIDKLTVFMTALGEGGEFLTREGYTKGTEQIDKELEKIREQYAPIKEKAMATLQEARSTRDLSKEFLRKELPRIEEAIRAVREERDHLLELIRGVIEQLQSTSRMPANLVEASKVSDQELLKALWPLYKNNRLQGIDARIAKYYSDIRALKSEKMEQLYQEKSDQFESLKDYQEMVKEARKSADEKLGPFKKKMRKLRELKKRYASTVENEIIEDIRSILEHPSNYISLIRPNGTDIVRPVADGPEGLAEHVQDYNPRENFTSAPPKKGVSPTRVLEVGYNLYKHESNNIGKRTLGIGAVENTYSTIFNRIGAYMNTSYVYPWGKVPQERRIKLLLPHNEFSSSREDVAIPDAGPAREQLKADLVKAGKIVLDKNGKVLQVKQNSGYPSQLFNDLADIVGDKEEALKAYLNIKSEPFKEKYGQWENTIMRQFGRSGYEYTIRKSSPDTKLTMHRPDEFAWSETEDGKKYTIFFNQERTSRTRPFEETKKDYIENIINPEIEEYKKQGNQEALSLARRYKAHFEETIKSLRDLKLHLIHNELYAAMNRGKLISPADIRQNYLNSLDEVARLNTVELAKDYYGEPLLIMSAGPAGIKQFIAPGEPGYKRRDEQTGVGGIYFNRDVKMIEKYGGFEPGGEKPGKGKDVYYAFLRTKKPFYILDPEAQKVRPMAHSKTLSQEDIETLKAHGYDSIIWERGYDVDGFEEKGPKPSRPKLEVVGLGGGQQVEIVASYNEGIRQGEEPRKRISLSNLYDAAGENRIADVISQLMNGWVDIEKDAWVFFVQGNNEITPTLLFLIKSGVPFRQAAWFVSQPLVREYVREQRLARSTFAGPMHKAPEEPNYYRVKAKSEVLKHIFGKTFKSQELYTKTVEMTNKALGANGEFTPEMIEKIVKTKDTQSDLAKAAFLHFLEIEEMMKGIANLKFKTNVDTRRSTTLFDAQNRLAEIEMLRDESRLPTELIDKVLEESVIGSFFVQDFQLKLWSKLFSLRNNDTLTQFLNGVIKDRDMRSEVEKNFGDDMERFVSEFKNDLLLFIFQNSLRDFNLGIDKTYKGMAVSEAPIKYVDKLEFGAFVKKDESGQPKIFVDPLQLKSDWISKAFTAGSSSANSYKERELATLPTKAFMWRGVDSEKEYYKFVVEREYLRYLIPFSDFQRTMEYKENYRRNQSILQQSKTTQESQEAFAARVARATYEQMLRNKALENTFNPWKMFQSDTSVPLQFLQIVQQYPQLEKEYSFISQLAVVSDPKLDMSNLTLKDRDLSADKVNRYYENLRKLSDPSVEKVPDREENMRISMFFAKLPMFAFMQSGLSKNANSFTAVVSYEPFVKMMEKPVKDFVNNVLNGPDAEVVLQRFMDQFIEQNGRRNRKMRSKFKNYLLDKTPRAMRSDYDPEAESTRPDVTRDLRPLNKEGTYGYTDMKIGALDKKTNTYNMTPKKTADYSAMLKGNPHVVFVFSDNVYSRENPNLKTGGSVDMRSMGNSMGILTALKRGEPMKNLTPEQITQMKNKIEADIMELVSLRDDGKDIAFSEAGYGSPDTMPDELFLYLSERLYEEFGFINPGSSSLPSVKEIIGREQGISQQEIDDFMRQCFGQ